MRLDSGIVITEATAIIAWVVKMFLMVLGAIEFFRVFFEQDYFICGILAFSIYFIEKIDFQYMEPMKVDNKPK